MLCLIARLSSICQHHVACIRGSQSTLRMTLSQYRPTLHRSIEMAQCPCCRLLQSSSQTAGSDRLDFRRGSQFIRLHVDTLVPSVSFHFPVHLHSRHKRPTSTIQGTIAAPRPDIKNILPLNTPLVSCFSTIPVLFLRPVPVSSSLITTPSVTRISIHHKHRICPIVTTYI